MSAIINLLSNTFDTKKKKSYGIFFLSCVVLSFVFDNIQLEGVNVLESAFGVVGVGGGAIYFGVLLLFTNPVEGIQKWQVVALSIASLLSGILLCGLFIYDWILIIFY